MMSNLYISEEPTLGRVLRTKMALKSGDVSLEEKPLLSYDIGKENDATGLVRSWYNFIKRVEDKHKVKLNEFRGSVLQLLGQSDEIRSQIFTHFYWQDYDTYLEKNTLKDFVDEAYVELCRWLELPENAVDCARGKYRLGGLTAADFWKLFHIVRLNMHSMGGGRGGLFPQATLMAHDCHYNTIFEFDNILGVLKLTTVRPVPAGGILTISYCNDQFCLAPVMIRRQHLYRVKSFWCWCDRCKADDITRPVKCPGQNCPGYLLSNMPRHRRGEAEWQCTHCRCLHQGVDLACPDAFTGLPIIKREYGLMVEAIEIIFNSTMLTALQAEAKIVQVKRELGEQHWLYFFYNVQLMMVQGLLSETFRVTTTWAARTYPDACRRVAAAQMLGVTILSHLQYLSRKSRDDINKIPMLHNWFCCLASAVPSMVSLLPSATDCEVCDVRDLRELCNEFATRRLGYCSCCFIQPITGCASASHSTLTVRGLPTPQVLFKCAACKEVAYCSKECQKRHWKREHKQACRSSSV